ncbi:MAG: hypothetical protein ACLFQV_03525 [Vulcanimicrobiota bacterium]
MIEKLENLNRRIIFVLVFLAVTIPLLVKIDMPVKVTRPVQNIYDFIESMPEASVIWMGFDYHATTRTECDSQAIAFLRHAFRKNHRLFFTSTIADGNGISKNIVKRIADEENKIYGEDYAILGYKPGNQAMMLQVCKNIRGIFNTDAYGTPITDLPVMNDIKNADDIDFLFTTSDNASFDYYVQVVNTQYGIPMAGGSTAVSVPKYYVYINSGQAIGILGGLKGAAEYETLIGEKGMALAGMNAQSFVHLFIVCLILLSNGIYFYKKFTSPAPKV